MSERPELLAGVRQRGESSKGVQACNDFLRLGPGRTLVGLFRKYQEMPGDMTPTRKRNTIEAWSKNFTWFERAAAYDKRLEEEKNARAREMMASGLALDYERVGELIVLADFLKAQIYTTAPARQEVAAEEAEPGESGTAYPYVWVRDVKQIGAGENAERVEIYRFNAAILDQYRGVMDDIARETGGRVNKHEVTGEDGKPIAISSDQHDRAISTLAAALGSLVSGSDTGG